MVNKMQRGFGVEIEFGGMECGTAREVVRDFLATEPAQLKLGWDVRPETSVPDGFELVSPPLRYEDLPILKGLYECLRNSGACTSPRAGVHVHVGIKDFTLSQLRALVNVYASNAELIIRMLNTSSVRRLLYCLPIRVFAEAVEKENPGNADELRNIWYRSMHASAPEITRYNSSRYSELNFNSYFYRGTIEFRAFNGAEEVADLEAYVFLALAITNYARENPNINRLCNPDIKDELDAIEEARKFFGAIWEDNAEFGRARAVLEDGISRYYCRRQAESRVASVKFHMLGTAFEGDSYSRILDQVADSRLFDLPELRKFHELYWKKGKRSWGGKNKEWWRTVPSSGMHEVQSEFAVRELVKAGVGQLVLSGKQFEGPMVCRPAWFSMVR